MQREISVYREDRTGGDYVIPLEDDHDAHARALDALHQDTDAIQAIVKHDRRQVTIYTQGDQEVEGQALPDAASVADAVRIVAMQLASEAREWGESMRRAESKRDSVPRPDIRGAKGTDAIYGQAEARRQQAQDRRNVAAAVAHNLGIWDAFDGYLRAMEGERGETL